MADKKNSSTLEPILIQPERGVQRLVELLEQYNISSEIQLIIAKTFARSIAESAFLDDRPACVDKFVDECIERVFG